MTKYVKEKVDKFSLHLLNDFPYLCKNWEGFWIKKLCTINRNWLYFLEYTYQGGAIYVLLFINSLKLACEHFLKLACEHDWSFIVSYLHMFIMWGGVMSLRLQIYLFGWAYTCEISWIPKDVILHLCICLFDDKRKECLTLCIWEIESYSETYIAYLLQYLNCHICQRTKATSWN